MTKTRRAAFGRFIDWATLVIAVCAAFGTIWQAYISNINGKRQLRAYAFVVASIKSFEVGKTPIFAITVKDGGENPTYHIGVIVRF
jgi:hypothetical protein